MGMRNVNGLGILGYALTYTLVAFADSTLPVYVWGPAGRAERLMTSHVARVHYCAMHAHCDP